MIAAALVSLMILFFLGSWRSVFIVCTSIPLSILVSIIGAESHRPHHQHHDAGRAVARHRHARRRRDGRSREHPPQPQHAPSLTVAILRGASQIALPAIVATLAICIVFFPVVLLTGPAKFLFTPMAEAVVFAMLASYVLSRTLVPVLRACCS